MIKLNGEYIDGILNRKGNLYNFVAELTDMPFNLFRSDKCTLETASSVCECTVVSSTTKVKYGTSKKRVLSLRIESMKDRVKEVAPIVVEVIPEPVEEKPPVIDTPKPVYKKKKKKKKKK